MAAVSFQKQSSRNLVLSANTQASYGGVLADANMTVRQRFDSSTVFSLTQSNRTDKMMAGKGSEWASDDQLTAYDSGGTLKFDADVFGLGFALSLIFGQETVTGNGPFTHTFTVPSITATMPCTTVYVEETNDVKRKFADMAAKSFSLDVPERGACSCSLDMVGTGRYFPGAMSSLPALIVGKYLLGNDVNVTFAPVGGQNSTTYSGRQKGMSIKVDRGSSPYQSSGDGLFAGSVASGDGKFSVDLTIAAEATDDINTLFESGQRVSVTVATNVVMPYQFAFIFPSARLKTSKVSNNEDKVVWSVSFDETTTIQVGNQAAITATLINDTPAYLIPA